MSNESCKQLTRDYLVENLKHFHIKEIANKTNSTCHTIYRYIKKYGIEYDASLEKFRQQYIGQKYGKLTILDYARQDKHNKRQVLCICDCGEKTVLNISSLTRGLTSSCGCAKRQKSRKMGYKEISYQFFRRAKKAALDKGIKFNITLKQIWDQYIKQQQLCVLSGLPIRFEPDGNHMERQTASIDRINSSDGYTKDNIQIVHRRINIMKGNLDMDELKYWVYRLYHTLEPQETELTEFKPHWRTGRKTEIEVT